MLRYFPFVLALALLAGCARATVGGEATPTPPAPLAPPSGSPTGSPAAGEALNPVPSATAPSAPAARLAAAREAERDGDWPRALELYGSLVGDPTHGPAALLAMGDLLARDQRPLEAAAAWQSVVTLAPGRPETSGARYRLARGLSAMGQHGRAIDLYREVDIASDAADDLLAMRLADAYRDSGQVALAVEQRERLYWLTEGDRVMRAQAARALGAYHTAGERWTDAERWYGRALDLSQVASYRAELVALLARAAEGRGDRAAALTRWREIVEAYPGTPSALAAIGALAALGAPLDAEAQGRLRLANGEGRAAARLFFAALEADDRAELHELAAEALSAAGDPTGAERQWALLIETHPEAATRHDDALFAIGRAQAERGERAAALATWAEVAARFPKGNAAADALWARATRLDTEADLAAFAARFPRDERAPEALFRTGLLAFERDPAAARSHFEGAATYPARGQPAQALFWAGKAARGAGDEAGARAHWRAAVAAGGADYYALRAAVLLGEAGAWQPRRVEALALPTGEELGWLADATGTAPSELDRLPDEPLLRQAEALLALGEREMARARFSEAITRWEGDAQPLWALSGHLHALDMPALASGAARGVMVALDYHAGDAPPALLARVYPLPYPVLVNEAAAGQGLSATVLAALIYQESRWEPAARSSAAARGLTQVIPDTGRWIATQLGDRQYEYRDLDRPVVALRYGTFYLDYVLDRFGQNPFHALAAYNAGPGNARRWLTPDDDLYLERIALSETRLYVEVVYEHWYAYERLATSGR